MTFRARFLLFRLPELAGLLAVICSVCPLARRASWLTAVALSKTTARYAAQTTIYCQGNVSDDPWRMVGTGVYVQWGRCWFHVRSIGAVPQVHGDIQVIDGLSIDVDRYSQTKPLKNLDDAFYADGPLVVPEHLSEH